MKKAANLFLLLVLIFVAKGFLLANAGAAEDIICWDSSYGVSYDGETYLLKNGIGNKELLVTHVSEILTLGTKIEIELELVKFSESIQSDEFILRLMTAEKDGLLLAFYNIKEEGKYTREIRAEIHKKGEPENFQTIQEIDDLFDETIKEISSSVIIQIEYSDDAYTIMFNSKKIELNTNLEKEAKAGLSLEIISGEPAFHSPEIKIISTILEIKEQENNEAGNPASGGGQKPEINEKEDNGKTGNDYRQAGISPENNSNQAALAITVSASALLAGVIFLKIRQTIRKK